MLSMFLNAEKVIATIRPINTSSINVAIRLGMKETGTYVKIYQGKEMPHLIFEIIK